MADTAVEAPEASAAAGAGSPTAPAGQNGATALPGAQGASPEAGADWRGAIPEALRGEKLWGKYKDLPAALQGHVEADKALGRMVAIPGPDAKPEQIAAFREKMGVPKEPSGYTPPEGEIDQKRWEFWTGHAHKLGLTPAQLGALAQLEQEERGGLVNGAKQQWAAGIDALKQEWGEQGFARKVTLAARAIDRHMSPEGKKFLDDSGLGNHPELVKAWASIGELHAEDGYIEGRIASLPSMDEAKAEIAAIRAQGAKHPANNPEMAGHKEARAALDAKYRLVYGTDTGGR